MASMSSRLPKCFHVFPQACGREIHALLRGIMVKLSSNGVPKNRGDFEGRHHEKSRPTLVCFFLFNCLLVSPIKSWTETVSLSCSCFHALPARQLDKCAQPQTTPFFRRKSNLEAKGNGRKLGMEPKGNSETEGKSCKQSSRVILNKASEVCLVGGNILTILWVCEICIINNSEIKYQTVLKSFDIIFRVAPNVSSVLSGNPTWSLQCLMLYTVLFRTKGLKVHLSTIQTWYCETFLLERKPIMNHHFPASKHSSEW